MKKNIEKLINRKEIKLSSEKGQYLTLNPQVIRDLIQVAEINKEDKVIEVGAGTGILTKALCQKAGKVYAYEIDRQFEPFLIKLTNNYKNLNVIIENIRRARLPRDYNKVVGNIPYHIAETLLWTFRKKNVQSIILVVPLKFAKKLTAGLKDKEFKEISIIFSARFDISIKRVYEPESFYPSPPVKSALIKMNYVNTKNIINTPPRYIFRYIWDHKNAKLKNALMEAFINFVIDKTKRKIRLTKNQARELVKSLKIEKWRLEKLVDESNTYEIADKIYDFDYKKVIAHLQRINRESTT